MGGANKKTLTWELKQGLLFSCATIFLALLAVLSELIRAPIYYVCNLVSKQDQSAAFLTSFVISAPIVPLIAMCIHLLLKWIFIGVKKEGVYTIYDFEHVIGL